MTRANDSTDSMSVNGHILKESRKTSKILTISNGDRIQAELGKCVTAYERKRIWVLIDGKRQTNDIATLSSASLRSVQAFLKTLEEAELIEKRRYGEAPKKSFNYVPAKWLEMGLGPSSSETLVGKTSTNLNTKHNESYGGEKHG